MRKRDKERGEGREATIVTVLVMVTPSLQSAASSLLAAFVMEIPSRI